MEAVGSGVAVTTMMMGVVVGIDVAITKGGCAAGVLMPSDRLPKLVRLHPRTLTNPSKTSNPIVALDSFPRSMVSTLLHRFGYRYETASALSWHKS